MNEIQDEYREYKKLCRVEDDPGVQGLAQLGRNAIERVTELERALAERDERISQIERSHAVLQARLRACGQVLVEEIGADGPENADTTAERAAGVIRQLTERADAAEHQNRNYALIIDALGKRTEAAERERDAIKGDYDEAAHCPSGRAGSSPAAQPVCVANLVDAARGHMRSKQDRQPPAEAHGGHYINSSILHPVHW